MGSNPHPATKKETYENILHGGPLNDFQVQLDPKINPLKILQRHGFLMGVAEYARNMDQRKLEEIFKTHKRFQKRIAAILEEMKKEAR